MNIKIERNLRKRRRVSKEGVSAEKLPVIRKCSIGSCKLPAIGIMVYHPKGKTPKEYLVCTLHSTGYAKLAFWSLKRIMAIFRKGKTELFKAIVITPNDKTLDLGCLLAIARTEACRREQVAVNPPVKALVFVAELGVYVAVYEVS